MGNMDDLSLRLLRQIKRFQYSLEPVSVGTVAAVGDGIARISGLGGVFIGEMLRFEGGTLGMVLNLERETVGAIVLGADESVDEGSEAWATGEPLSVPVGDTLLGRVVNALGEPLDELGPLEPSRHRPIESAAPAIIDRTPVNVPLQTGIKAIDALVPIGRGQRELIVGDRQTGKTTLALDAILHQRGNGVLCVYVAIGQKLANVAQVVRILREHDALDHTIIVTEDASAPASLQYLAPYSGCAMAEEFMESGRDALIVYDDLTKHAWAYRQISLLLRRPPGREAYPGDIFYLHARLLERAARLNASLGGGSMTALPIIETQLGDIASYIPTNVIAITDGQIYLENELFNAGIRPAINAGLSVSRVGGAAQHPAMSSVAGRMRLDLAGYRELAAFAQFGTELDAATQHVLDRGARVREILKQDQHVGVDVGDQILLMYAVANGHLDDVPMDEIAGFEKGLIRYYHQGHHSQLRDAIAVRHELTPELEHGLDEVIEDFQKLQSA